ncbi:MAG TPA: hypothetical protein VFV34_29270 [Blastocatellia bacterium]|nr:hypothetical protein [Blastocatellia bacterium]
MRRRILWPGAIAITILFGLAGGVCGQQLHPKLKNKEKVIQTVLIVPPKIEIVKSTMKGGEGMLKETEAVEAVLQKTLSDVLRSKGFKVMESPAPDAVQNAEQVKYALADIQSRYDQVHPKILAKKKDVAKGRFTLGEQVGSVSDVAQADVVVFVRGVGEVLTTAKRFVRAFAKSGPAFSNIALSIAVVDGQTGEVLYFDTRTAVGNFTEKPEKVFEKPIAKSMKKVPAATAK